jgi:Holliday junction DNA helicase RuvA
LIAKLKGVVDEVHHSSLYLDVNSVVYEVFTPLPLLNEFEVNQKTTLHISEIIREDSYTLYGFKEFSDKTIFEELLKISGVGAKVSIAILSTLSRSELSRILDTEDEKALTKVPKIGLKSAKKIMIELLSIRDKLNLDSVDSSSKEVGVAIEALLQLGFPQKDIVKAIDSCSGETHQELIKEALKILSR